MGSSKKSSPRQHQFQLFQMHFFVVVCNLMGKGHKDAKQDFVIMSKREWTKQPKKNNWFFSCQMQYMTVLKTSFFAQLTSNSTQIDSGSWSNPQQFFLRMFRHKMLHIQTSDAVQNHFLKRLTVAWLFFSALTGISLNVMTL